MDNRVICVVGPTATGKTKMGVALAKRFGGEVVSVDSMQIYRGMTIGTAAPTAEEMDGVRHHMVAIADPAEKTLALALLGLGFATLWRMDVLAYAVEAWIQLAFGWVLAMFVIF